MRQTMRRVLPAAVLALLGAVMLSQVVYAQQSVRHAKPQQLQIKNHQLSWCLMGNR
jgi:hypothetical protein